MNGLNWLWIAIAVTVPVLLGAAAAYPFWRMQQPIFGNVVGSTVIFGAAIALIMREHVELDELVQRCLDAGTMCWPTPSAFTRYAIYAFVALFQVIVLFSTSVGVEARIRRRGYAPEWR